MTKRIFLGISKRTYSLIIRDSETKESVKYPAVQTEHCSKHEIILTALYDALRKLNRNETVIFYPNDDLVSFEWEKDYKVDGEFTSRTKDVELWNKIVTITKLKNINLTIKNSDDILSALGRFG